MERGFRTIIDERQRQRKLKTGEESTKGKGKVTILEKRLLIGNRETKKRI